MRAAGLEPETAGPDVPADPDLHLFADVALRLFRGTRDVGYEPRVVHGGQPVGAQCHERVHALAWLQAQVRAGRADVGPGHEPVDAAGPEVAAARTEQAAEAVVPAVRRILVAAGVVVLQLQPRRTRSGEGIARLDMVVPGAMVQVGRRRFGHARLASCTIDSN